MNVKKQTPRIMVVDDELLQRKIVSRQLAELEFAVETAETAAAALEMLQKKDFDVVLLDIQMSDLSGLDALPLIKKLEDAPEVIMLTLDKSLESGVAAMRAGAYDYLTKPATLAELEVTVTKAAEKRRLVRQNKTLTDFVGSRTLNGGGGAGSSSSGTSNGAANGFLQPVSFSPSMRSIIEQADAVANLNSTVLLTGESGTGKDVLARYIHSRSPRARQAMVTVNCGAMPESLFEAEFFGYERGAFTGASQTKRGLIEVANGSTLFLDEVGEMPIGLQVKLLRFLENGEFRRIGSTRDLASDARIIAATNQELTEAIRENRFRSDLYYRLNVIHLHVPPLRERPEDINALIDYYLGFYRLQFRKPNLHFSAEARQKLESYDYPGNVREMKNIIERAAVLAIGDQIAAENLYFQKANGSGRVFNDQSASLSFDPNDLTDKAIVKLEDLERRYILSVLKYTSGNRERAAALLGISERTLYRRLRDYE